MKNQNRDLELAFKNDHSTSNEFSFPPEFPTSVRMPRELQVDCLKAISGGPHGLINAAMAFGKSTIACIHAAIYLVNNPEGRVVIAIPEDTIGESFRISVIIDGKECNTKLVIEKDFVSFGNDVDQSKIDEYLETAMFLEWVIGNDLVGNSENKIAELKRFLKNRKKGSPSSRICLVTRQTMVLAFSGMRDKTRRELLKNTLIVIDEAHTLSTSETHKFGTMYQWLRNNSDELNIRTLLLTATFFRGDKMRIMTDEQYNSLCVYKLSFKDYFNSLTYLEEISIRFVFYDYLLGPASLIESLIQDEIITKPIVYLPARSSVNGHFPSSQKPEEVKSIMKAIAKGHGHKGSFRPKRIAGTSIFKIKINSDKDIIVADLTDSTYIKATKKYLDKIKTDPDGLDAIISLNRAQQGFDWVFCDGTIALGKRSSMTMIVQISGRSCRDSKGKKTATILFAIPANRAGLNANRDKIRVSVTDCTNAIIACMQLHDVFEPVTIPVKLPGMATEERIEMQDVLSILFNGEKARSEFESSIEQAFEEGERFSCLKNADKKEIISQIMLSNGISEEDVEAYLDPIFRLFEKRRKRMADVISRAVEGSPILEELRRYCNFTVEDQQRGARLAYMANHIGVDSLDDVDDAISKIRIERLSNKKFVDAIQDFYAKNNRMPSSDSDNHWERRLAKEFDGRVKNNDFRNVAIANSKDVGRLIVA